MTFLDLSKALTIGQGRRMGNLYVLDTNASEVSVNAVVDIGVWHKRLGHLSYSRLDSIAAHLGTTKLKNKGFLTVMSAIWQSRRSCHTLLQIIFVIPILSCYTLIFGVLFLLKQLMAFVIL